MLRTINLPEENERILEENSDTRIHNGLLCRRRQIYRLHITIFFLHIYDLTVPHVENEPFIFGLYNILLASDSMCTIKLKTHF